MMSIFNIFRRKRQNAPVQNTSNYTDLRVTEDGNGARTLMLWDPTSGDTAPFPPIDILLRDIEGIEQTKQVLKKAGAGDENFPVTTSIAPDLVEVLALDTGHSFIILSQADLQQKGITHALAREGAMIRLKAAANDLDVQGGDGRYRAQFSDEPDLSASFLLILEEWLDLDAIDGAPVFAIGTRVFVHVCGAHDTASLAGMKEIAETMHAESTTDPVANGKPLSPQLLTLKDGQIQPFPM